MEFRTMFVEAMAKAGIVTHDPIIADGELHRIHIGGEEPSERYGWHILFADKVPSGAFGSWKRGIFEIWCGKSIPTLTEPERQILLQRMDKVKVAWEREDRVIKAAAQKMADNIWKNASPAQDSHPYLVMKGIKVHLLREDQGSVIAPLYNADGELSSLQQMSPDGTKSFLTGGRVEGCYHLLGKPRSMIYVAVDYCTGATIHELTGEAVAVVFRIDNLLSVARIMRRKFAKIQIIIAGDDDGSDESSGLTEAYEAARAVKGFLTLPEFQKGNEGMNFNDLVRLEGPKATLQLLRSPVGIPPEEDVPMVLVKAWLQSGSDDIGPIIHRLRELSNHDYDSVRVKVAKQAGIQIEALDSMICSNSAESGSG